MTDRVRKRNRRITLFTLQVLDGFQFGGHTELVCITNKYGRRWRRILLTLRMDGIRNDLLLLRSIAMLPMRVEEEKLNVCGLVPEPSHGHPVPAHERDPM